MSKSIDELAEDGRGVKLMWQIADELSYTRTLDGRNCLLLTKNYQAEICDRPKNIKKASALDELLNLLNQWDWLAQEQQAEELKESRVQKISLQVNNHLNALTEVLEWFEQLEDLSLPNQVWWGCQLALAEGFTNAVRHAHKDLPHSTPIQLEVTVFKGYLELRIWDGGQYFDLNAKLREIMAAEIKSCLDLDDFSAPCLVPSRTEKLEESLLLVAG